MVSNVPLAQRCLIMILFSPNPCSLNGKLRNKVDIHLQKKKEGKVGIIYIKSVFPNSYASLERNTILATAF